MAANPIASSSSPILDSGAETKLRGLAEKKQLLVSTIAGMLGPLIHYNGLYQNSSRWLQVVGAVQKKKTASSQDKVVFGRVYFM